MNIDDTVRAVTEKGFTERQARFLVLVARHSGVCVMRQYSAFAGIVFGQKTRKFFAKLERLGYVSTYDCAHKRQVTMMSKALFGRIGDAGAWAMTLRVTKYLMASFETYVVTGVFRGRTVTYSASTLSPSKGRV